VINLPTTLIAGRFEEEQLGFHFQTACQTMGITHHVLNSKQAKSPFDLLNKLFWRLFDKSYVHQRRFQNELIRTCDQKKIELLIVLGNTPVSKETLETLKLQGVKTVNFLSDDPWNSNESSSWFMRSLPSYHLLTTPRKSNFAELKQLTSEAVIYLPFAYNPYTHFEEPPLSPNDEKLYGCDVMFFGGADKDRLPYVRELIEQGISLKLYGGFWDRFSDTRPFAMGIIPVSRLRKAVKASKIVLNLVRRANRDGHVMRTFEGPAMGGCMLNELTEEHIEIFGKENALFFSSLQDLTEKTLSLLGSPEIRARYCRLTQKKILSGNNTYLDRLKTILERVVTLKS